MPLKELQFSEPAVKSALTMGIGFLATKPIGLKPSVAVVFINLAPIRQLEGGNSTLEKARSFDCHCEGRRPEAIS